jgi:hypothetical protein
MRETFGGSDLLEQDKLVDGAHVDQSEENREKVKVLLSQFFKWKSHREQYSKNWMEYYKFFRGAQWDSQRPSWKSSEVVNLIWSAIQSQIPLQTDVRPKFSFLPQEPSDMLFASILEKIADSEWEKYNWLRVVFEVILDGYIYGTGFSSMNYDPDIDYGIGAAVYKSEDPFYCYPDPDCNDINDSISRGFWYVRPMTTSRLKSKYPKFANKIKGDVIDFIGKQRADVKSSGTYAENNTDKNMPEYMSYSATYDCKIEKTLVFEGFLKPSDMEEIEEDVEGENGETKKQYTIKKKHPEGRHVVIANGLLLLDEEMPYEDGLIPFSRYNNYILSREFFGVSEIEQLKPSQVVFNKILSFALDSMALMGNPIWISDDPQLDISNLTNKPGLVVPKSPGSTVTREMGVPLNPGFMQILDRLVGWFNDQAGQSEFSRGNTEGAVTAASAIEQLISASRTRIRQRQRNLDEYLKTVGRQYANRVFEFYSVPKIYRITNDDGSKMFMKMSIENQEGENGEAVRIAKVTPYNESKTGEILPGRQETLIIKGNFDIRVKTGSDLPFEATDKERKALALFDRGIIDEEEVLDQINMPNKEKILQRLAERQQMLAQQQQQGA